MWQGRFSLLNRACRSNDLKSSDLTPPEEAVGDFFAWTLMASLLVRVRAPELTIVFRSIEWLF